MSRTLSGLFLVGALNRPRKRKIPETPPPLLKPPRLAALENIDRKSIETD